MAGGSTDRDTFLLKGPSSDCCLPAFAHARRCRRLRLHSQQGLATKRSQHLKDPDKPGASAAHPQADTATFQESGLHDPPREAASPGEAPQARLGFLRAGEVSLLRTNPSLHSLHKHLLSHYELVRRETRVPTCKDLMLF